MLLRMLWKYRGLISVWHPQDRASWCILIVKTNWMHHFSNLLWYKLVKGPRYRPGVAQRVGSGIALLFHDRGTRRGWVVSSTPRPHFSPRDRPGTHCTGGWVGPRAGLDGWKISSPPGFWYRTIQPVVEWPRGFQEIKVPRFHDDGTGWW